MMHVPLDLLLQLGVADDRRASVGVFAVDPFLDFGDGGVALIHHVVPRQREVGVDPRGDAGDAGGG